MANLGWLSLSEALDFLTPEQGQQQRKEAAGLLLSALSKGDIIATALDGNGNHVDIAADDWTRGRPDWYASTLIIGPPQPILHDGVMNRKPVGPLGRRYFAVRIPQERVAALIPGRPRAKGGAPEKFPWAKIREEAFAVMRKMGVPGPDNDRMRHQSQLEDILMHHCAEHFGGEPGLSTLRGYLKGWIRDYSRSETGS